VNVRIPTIDFYHGIPAKAAGCEAQEDLRLARLRVRGTNVRELKRLLEVAEFEDASQALAVRHLPVGLQVHRKSFRIGI